ncbi:ABC transporter permease [Streptomyces nitrosporeus]|uniref:ABC transporter permease n=1 Tax=Streptomyces nitrosporeus TaxID=28894 RepID=A0A5J6FFF4_9ACTN|nr:ABC transporter permease [Streptomyces nitrosporeus]QEU73680.1 ABC transporter permease [Streptomyces nitrosporeus]GGZ12083.1 exporter of polyketide antibiotics [Streptomyces nitrosporeus]
MTSAATRAPAPAPARPPARSGGALAGTLALIRFGLRRDRVRLPVWLLALSAGTAATAANYATLYAGPADRASAAAAMASPAGLAMTGPRHYLDDYTSGAMTAHQLLGFTVVLAGLMSALTVIRHTRAEEETGRAELVRSTAVGRHAHLAAALAIASLAGLALALLLALGLGATGLDPGGSLLYGFAHAAAGAVFAGVAAVTAQITPHTRGASGTAVAVIGLAYALRAAGDAGGGDALSWLSPVGWVQRAYPYADDRWWPLLLCLVLAVLCAGAGFALSARRDVGAGLRAARPGSPAASASLVRPPGLALRLHRSALAGFGAGVFLMGAMYGSVLGDAEGMLKDIDPLQEALDGIGGATTAESFASMVMVVLAVVTAVYVVTAALRPRSEESAGRAEPLLAAGLSRASWAGSHLAVAMAGGTFLLLLAGLGIGAAGAASAGDPGLLPELVGAALAYAPALWVTAGVAAVLHGWLPRAAPAAWAVPVYAFVAGYLGPLLRFPGWADGLSPFAHVPRLPSAAMGWTPLAVLTLIAAGLLLLGLEGYRRRDLRTA